MAVLYHNLSIASFNYKGHSEDRLHYVNSLCNTYDVVLLQEHWYHDHEIQALNSCIKNVQVYGSSGMDQSQLLHGRPYGGCAILINDRLKCKFSPLPVSKRCYSGVLELFGGVKIIISNVYMPCDTTHDYTNLDQYCNVLIDFMDVCNTNPDINRMILGGDFNTRSRNSNY